MNQIHDVYKFEHLYRIASGFVDYFTGEYQKAYLKFFDIVKKSIRIIPLSFREQITGIKTQFNLLARQLDLVTTEPFEFNPLQDICDDKTDCLAMQFKLEPFGSNQAIQLRSTRKTWNFLVYKLTATRFSPLRKLLMASKSSVRFSSNMKILSYKKRYVWNIFKSVLWLSKIIWANRCDQKITNAIFRCSNLFSI